MHRCRLMAELHCDLEEVGEGVVDHLKHVQDDPTEVGSQHYLDIRTSPIQFEESYLQGHKENIGRNERAFPIDH